MPLLDNEKVADMLVQFYHLGTRVLWEKGRDLTLSYDKSPYTTRKMLTFLAAAVLQFSKESELPENDYGALLPSLTIQTNIYNGIIFPSLNPAKIFDSIPDN